MKTIPQFESRRTFLGNVNKGMIAAVVGSPFANDLGFSTAFAEENAKFDRLQFGSLEPLVSLMQETGPEKLQPILVKKIQSGEADLKTLIAAGALANARSFGGRDYDGFHCMMALVPALEMATELPTEEKPLPVLKVLYRNSGRLQRFLRSKSETLHAVPSGSEISAEKNAGELLREATRNGKTLEAEQILGTLVNRSPQAAYDALHLAIRDKPDVHGTALAHRAWETLELIGEEHAHTLLRQSVRFVSRKGINGTLQKTLAKELSRLEGKKAGDRVPDDAWLMELTKTIYESPRCVAAQAVGKALAEGVSPEAVGEAISLAANEIILRQASNRVHGDSRGVHASDATNAWRNISRVTNPKNQFASLIVAAYQVADEGRGVIIGRSSDSPLSDDPDPFALFRGKAKEKTPEKLLAETEEAILANDQFRASSAILAYGETGAEARPVFDLFLKYAVSEDGRLHAEKYYRTVTEEFAAIRPAFRGRQLVTLARITASAYGKNRKDQSAGRAPGYLEARELLGLA